MKRKEKNKNVSGSLPYYKTTVVFLLFCLAVLTYCSRPAPDAGIKDNDETDWLSSDSVEPEAEIEEYSEALIEEEPDVIPQIRDVAVEKDITYDKYTLADTYPYNKKTRSFQWDKIKDGLRRLDSFQIKPARWGVLQNRRNVNGEASLVKNYKTNDFNRIIDTFGTERYQNVPLYTITDSVVPVRYGQDGLLVKLLDEGDDYVRFSVACFDGEWVTPKKYVKVLPDSITFDKIIFVDRHNQNIAVLEKDEDFKWLVRSMNPSTTGKHKPPLKHETPLGLFVIQEKKAKMYYYLDHTTDIAGYSPHASRFSQGGYIHGIPVNLPETEEIEYSWSLGTTPKSHMCVRTASSHAKYIYDWAPVEKSLVYVIE
jgi:hypothetical protein